MYDTDHIFNKLFNYFEVDTIKDLSDKIDISQSTVSKWKQRSSFTGLKKKCRELGIYSEIFGDINTQNINDISGGQVAQNVSGNQTQELMHTKAESIDTATYNLFKEAYDKALKNDDLKALRIHLMDY